MPATEPLNLTPLTAAAFAPYGEVIETTGRTPIPINNGSASRFDDLARIETATQGGHPVVSIFSGQAFTSPVVVAEMESHPLGSQAFMPLDGRPYLVVVAASGADGEPLGPRAFLANGFQGVNYPAGRWHHPLLALGEQSRFLVIDRGGSGENLRCATYPVPFEIALPSPAGG